MIVIRTETRIEAPVERCFDLARDIDIHTRTVWKHTRERAVGGTTSGMIEAGGQVTFEARHFGVRQRLTSRIVEFERPYLFVDQMVSGAFKSLRHTHLFRTEGAGTAMTDELMLEAPLGPLGAIAERLVLAWYMRRFLEHRNLRLKAFAERGAAASVLHNTIK